MADESVKISLFPLMPTVGTPPRLAWKCSLLTTAQVSYGAKYANENFQIPMDVLRSDFTGYVGIENVRPAWTDTVKIWRGKWWGEREGSEGNIIPDRANSYTYVWDDEWIGYADYLTYEQKFKQDGLYFLTEAPIPLEEPVRCDTGELALDPATFTTKIVSKDYVDARHNGFRKLENTGNVLAIRPYTCYYNLKDFDGVVDITDENMTDDIEKNRLTFYIEVGVDALSQHALKFSVNGNEANFREPYGSSLNGVIQEALSRGVDAAIIELTAEKVDGEFVVSLTEAENLGTVSLRSGYGDIQDNVYTFTSHVKENDDHGVDVFLDSMSTTVMKRLVNKDGALQVQKGNTKTLNSSSYLFSVDDECTADNFSFVVGATHFKDAGEHNKMTRFCVSGTLYRHITHLNMNGSFIGICSTEPTVQDEYERVIFRVVDDEAEDERTRISVQDGKLALTTQTRKERFGVDDILIYHNHTEWEDAETQTIDVSKLASNSHKVVTPLNEVVKMNDNVGSSFTITLDADKSATLDMDGLEDDGEYIWRIYVRTGVYDAPKTFDLWAMADGEIGEIEWVDDQLHAPFVLPSNAVVCMEITRLPENEIFGRILWSKTK